MVFIEKKGKENMSGNRNWNKKKDRLYEVPLNGICRKRVRKTCQKIGIGRKRKDRLYKVPINGSCKRKVR